MCHIAARYCSKYWNNLFFTWNKWIKSCVNYFLRHSWAFILAKFVVLSNKSENICEISMIFQWFFTSLIPTKKLKTTNIHAQTLSFFRVGYFSSRASEEVTRTLACSNSFAQRTSIDGGTWTYISNLFDSKRSHYSGSKPQINLSLTGRLSGACV